MLMYFPNATVLVTSFVRALETKYKTKYLKLYLNDLCVNACDLTRFQFQPVDGPENNIFKSLSSLQ